MKNEPALPPLIAVAIRTQSVSCPASSHGKFSFTRHIYRRYDPNHYSVNYRQSCSYPCLSSASYYASMRQVKSVV